MAVSEGGENVMVFNNLQSASATLSATFKESIWTGAASFNLRLTVDGELASIVVLDGSMNAIAGVSSFFLQLIRQIKMKNR